MSITRITTGITAGILVIAGILYYSFRDPGRNFKANNVKIEQTWELPSILKEVSGLSWVGKDRIACIQDEDGILFIYNLSSSKIEKQIKFGENADYEGVEIVNTTAYILLSDGNLIEISNYNTDPKIKNITTGLPKGEDFEGLAFDSAKNRLLLAHKEENTDNESIKAIYAYDLNSGKTEKNPVYRIKLEDPAFNKISGKRIHNKFRSSGMGIDQKTGKIYLVEGTDPKLLILDAKAEVENLYFLDNKKFPQPEGIAINPNGDLFISTEGKPGMIHHVSIK